MIGYYVHHQGAGHATRACAVAALLGEPVTGFSSAPRPAGWPGAWVRLPADDTPAPLPAQDVEAGGALHWAPLAHAGYGERMGAMARWITDAQPGAFVVDVSVEVTALARLLGAPTVVMAMRGDRRDGPHALAYDAATTLVAPWPASYPEPWWPTRWLDKTVHTGAISRFDGLTPDGCVQPRRGALLWGRGGGEADVAGLRAATPQWTWTLPEGTPQDVWAALTRAEVVVSHGGQNAVAEVAAARRPAVVVADPRPFAEQEHTVAALREAGLAVACDTWPSAEQWPGLLAAAIELGGERWARWNDGAGARHAAEAISAAARTGHTNTLGAAAGAASVPPAAVPSSTGGVS